VHGAVLLVNGRSAVRIRSPARAEGARPHPRQAVRGAQALRRPVLHGQVVHRAPQRAGADGQPARLPSGLAAGCGEPDISYVRGGQRVRKDTKTHQDRWLAIDPDTCALIAAYLDEIRAAPAAVEVELRDDAYLFSNDPAHARPWNPDWVTHQIAAAADAAGVEFDIKGGRHYTASQLLAGGFDLRSTAARLGHSGGRATTLRHYADPVPEVDRRGFGSSRW
jgi:hypothetical protein